MASTSTTYLKVALCVTLLLLVECRVIKIEEDDSDSGDVTMKIIIKHGKRDTNPKVTTEKVYEDVKIDQAKEPTNGQDDLDSFLAHLLEDKSKSEPTSKPKEAEPNPDFIPDFNSRSGIEVGSCPHGYVRRGPVCLPNTV